MHAYLSAFFLGALQGVTEFLPISSSGHLALTQQFLTWHTSDLFFILVVHLGTLFAICTFYRQELLVFLSELKISSHNKVQALKTMSVLSVALLPSIIGAYFLKNLVDQSLNNPFIIGLGFLVTGVYLFFSMFCGSQTKHFTIAHLSFRKAFLIGLSQVVAFFPGFSRSGLTIATAFFLHVPKKQAVFFSFLLSIPIIIGACALELITKPFTSVLEVKQLLIAFISSYIFGWWSLSLLVILTKKYKAALAGFALYLCPLGVILIYLYPIL